MATPGVTTLATIRSTVRQRSDKVGSQFVTDAELNSYIASSQQELYGILVQHFGDDYYMASPYQFVTDGVNYLFPLPSDMFKLLGVDLQLPGGAPNAFVTLHRFNFADRNRFAVPNFQSFFGFTNLRYRQAGSNLWLTPLPVSGQTVQLWYAPRLTPVVQDTDTVDGVNGWEEYIVADAIIKALAKEETDVSVFMAQKQALLERIESEAANRDAGSPATTADSRISDFGAVNGTGDSWTGGGGV